VAFVFVDITQSVFDAPEAVVLLLPYLVVFVPCHSLLKLRTEPFQQRRQPWNLVQLGSEIFEALLDPSPGAWPQLLRRYHPISDLVCSNAIILHEILSISFQSEANSIRCNTCSLTTLDI
jgi:hypothetical protein